MPRRRSTGCRRLERLELLWLRMECGPLGVHLGGVDVSPRVVGTTAVRRHGTVQLALLAGRGSQNSGAVPTPNSYLSKPHAFTQTARTLTMVVTN